MTSPKQGGAAGVQEQALAAGGEGEGRECSGFGLHGGFARRVVRPNV